jgi:hypothetical protein
MAKKIILVKNDVEGLDLITERDGGNDVRILTGNQSLQFWKNLKATATLAIQQLESKKASGIYKGR